ncbi:MAG TPA: GDSL-type esterase/lipase family protein [Candidatus Acidoferrales bacterium]|nr:GDSL-type esterase/lipase family protein [Candidatus Acidoferrales bacterium]
MKVPVPVLLVVLVLIMTACGTQTRPTTTTAAAAASTTGNPVYTAPEVVFMGDSITAWWNMPTYFPGKHYDDEGVPGNTTAQMLTRFSSDVIAYNPKVVVILGGTNSLGYVSNEEVESELQGMYTAAQQAGIKVVACTITPRRPTASDARGDLTPQIVAVNEWIRNYCANNGIVVADYYPALAGPDGWLPENLTVDFVHLTPEAYSIITPIAAQAIASAEQQ